MIYKSPLDFDTYPYWGFECQGYKDWGVSCKFESAKLYTILGIEDIWTEEGPVDRP